MADTELINETLLTVTDYINDARVLLLDKVSPYRYDDTSLLTAFNVALLEGRRLRPDLFVFKHKQNVPYFTTNDGQEVDIEMQFRLAFVYGLCAHALLRDQEDIQDARADDFKAMFKFILTGSRPTGRPPQNAPGQRDRQQQSQGG